MMADTFPKMLAYIRAEGEGGFGSVRKEAGRKGENNIYINREQRDTQGADALI